MGCIDYENLIQVDKHKKENKKNKKKLFEKKYYDEL